jgi:hypothetical protein
MDEFRFEPIVINSNAPGGARVLLNFGYVGAFILMHVDIPARGTKRWNVVRRNLPDARFGAKEAEVHQALRRALSEEGWLTG